MRKERIKKGGLHQVVAQLPSLMSPDCLCPPSAVHPDTYSRALAQNNNVAAVPVPLAVPNRLHTHRQSMRLDMNMYNRQSLKTRIKTLMGANLELSKRVDLISRFMFPALFGLFLGES